MAIHNSRFSDHDSKINYIINLVGAMMNEDVQVDRDILGPGSFGGSSVGYGMGITPLIFRFRQSNVNVAISVDLDHVPEDVIARDIVSRARSYMDKERNKRVTEAMMYKGTSAPPVPSKDLANKVLDEHRLAKQRQREEAQSIVNHHTDRIAGMLGKSLSQQPQDNYQKELQGRVDRWLN